MSTPPRALFAGLVDDAAMFPPGNADPATALAEHLRYRAAWFSDLIGPLLVPTRGFESFAAAHAGAGSPAVALVLIGTTSLPDPVPQGMTVVGFEAPVAAPPIPSTADALPLAAEIQAGPAGERVVEAIAAALQHDRRVLAKFRTGGITADLFPSEETLAQVLAAAHAAGVPLKLTAGLHHAVRATAPSTGFEQHGFLNVLVATARTCDGGDLRSVTDALCLRDPGALVGQLAGLDAGQVQRIRSRFVSFGCCGVEDPVGDLLELGLIEE